VIPENGKRHEAKSMAYSVKQLAVMSGVTVRTLHFFDEMALLKPAAPGRTATESTKSRKLLMLQQILFYRELGFRTEAHQGNSEPATIRKIAALKSHRQVSKRTSRGHARLIETIDKTLSHLKGTKKMKSEELFMGFSIGAGKDRSMMVSTATARRLIARSQERTPVAQCVFWK